MKTNHEIIIGDSARLDSIADESVALVVTSPPYPMIEMWDEIFARQDPAVRDALDSGDGPAAFETMHGVLDRVWAEVHRVLQPGGLACVNIGDATRSIAGEFALYPNHARILTECLRLGFTNLPAVIWRKQTNAPNKFMGSGMLPAGAYVTLEHEYILILRKGGKRVFATPEEKLHRAESALFWEERNVWFSDVWFDLKGSRQKMTNKKSRDRSGAFPFELAYRLINMYSVRGDLVLDPFLGTGVTMGAAIASGRDSVGVEIDPDLREAIIASTTDGLANRANERVRQRLANHLEFVRQRQETKGEDAFKRQNKKYGFPVVTRQEAELMLPFVREVEVVSKNRLQARYEETPLLEYFESDSLFGALNR